MYNSQIKPEKTSKNTSRFVAYSILLGTFLGVVLGNIYGHEIYLILISNVISMLIGYFLGKAKDKKVNEQVQKLSYAVDKSVYDKNSNSYKVFIVDRKQNEKIINLAAKHYKNLDLKKGELVYLDSKGKISPVYSHTKANKNKSFLDLANEYKGLKNENKNDEIKK